jgi:hypothetical protein
VLHRLLHDVACCSAVAPHLARSLLLMVTTAAAKAQHQLLPGSSSPLVPAQGLTSKLQLALCRCRQDNCHSCRCLHSSRHSPHCPHQLCCSSPSAHWGGCRRPAQGTSFQAYQASSPAGCCQQHSCLLGHPNLLWHPDDMAANTLSIMSQRLHAPPCTQQQAVSGYLRLCRNASCLHASWPTCHR